MSLSQPFTITVYICHPLEMGHKCKNILLIINLPLSSSSTSNRELLLQFSLCSSHLHPLQVENCHSNWWFVVDENDNGKFRLKRVK